MNNTINNNSHSTDVHSDVIIIGAGPSGTVAASLLRKQGIDVLVLEKEHFPRFSIGESLLPQCMTFIKECGMQDAIEAAGFQYKHGAAFQYGSQSTSIDFREKFTAGPGTTFQVQRGKFDQLLAQQAELAGATINYGHAITDANFDSAMAQLSVRTDNGGNYQATARFVLDASGFGRVLPRLLDLEIPSDFPSRCSLFCHIEDNFDPALFDRDKILITIHPQHRDVWYWTIPFSDGRCSIGVVAKKEFIDNYTGDNSERLIQICNEDPNLHKILANAQWDTPVRSIQGYSCNVKQLWGNNYALLGNAGEFLDPVFSSGVTIAMKSASLAAPLVTRQLNGDTVDWDNAYAQPLMTGVNTFRTFVESWYQGGFQDVLFTPSNTDTIRNMLSSILAGYAWDQNNPYVKDSRRRLTALVETCQNP